MAWSIVRVKHLESDSPKLEPVLYLSLNGEEPTALPGVNQCSLHPNRTRFDLNNTIPKFLCPSEHPLALDHLF